METASLKLNENYPLASLTPPRSSAGGINHPLPLDPWLTAPMASAAAAVHTLPGFTVAYPGFMTQGGHMPTVSLTLSPGSQSGVALSPTRNEGGGDPRDPRSSSIVSLRMKAKEHMENLGRGLTG